MGFTVYVVTEVVSVAIHASVSMRLHRQDCSDSGLIVRARCHIALAQKDRETLEGLRDARRTLKRNLGAPGNELAENHWQRKLRDVERAMRDILRRHPSLRKPCDPNQEESMKSQATINWITERDEGMTMILAEIQEATSRAATLWSLVVARLSAEDSDYLEAFVDLQVLLQNIIRPQVDDLTAVVIEAGARLDAD